MYKTTLAFAGRLFLVGAAMNAWAATNDHFMIGAWARNRADCAQPELTFSEHRLDIAMDADGQPIRFIYPDLTYRLSARTILVKLGKPHPYSKTADKDALEFKQLTTDVVEMQKSKGKNTKFFRCARQR